MLLELTIAILIGIAAGTITGLTPGIHINLIAAILMASIFGLSFFPIILAAFIVAMAITHTFLDFIPSIFLGAPEEDSFLAVLPGHQLLKQGHAFKAVIFTLYGSLTSLIIILVFIPIFIFIIPHLVPTFQIIIPYLLIFISLFLIFREKEFLPALTIFMLAGFLGYAALNLPVKQPLLPLLTGLFGSSALIISLKQTPFLIKQKIIPIKKIRLPKSSFLKATLAAIISAPLSSFLPGLGSGHAAVIGSEIIPQKQESFLFLVGAINTIVMALSFITIFSIGRTRTGAAVAIQSILQTITTQQLITLVITIIISSIAAFFIGIQIAKFFAKYLNKINYRYLTITILSILILITIIFSNLLGYLVLITSTSLGIFTILSGARRINLMGALLIPTILFYLL